MDEKWQDNKKAHNWRIKWISSAEKCKIESQQKENKKQRIYFEISDIIIKSSVEE